MVTTRATVMSLGLGAMSLAFGLLKLIDPFRAWYAAQVAGSGLPALSYPLGIATEVLTGALFVGAWVWRRRLGSRLVWVWSLASIAVIATMLVATYVHLQPGVPGDVLPLKIKPPIIPLTVLVASVLNLVALRRNPVIEPYGP